MSDRLAVHVCGARRVRCRAAAMLALAAVALALSACQRRAERSPNLLLVVVDTLRADRLGAYGNSRQLTPFLDELAARAAVFGNAYSASSWTCPSVASLFTSRYPSQHHVVSFASRLGDAETTLAEALADRHYVAGGFSGNFRLLEALGYGQGFTHWEAEMKQDGDPSAAELNAQALRWLDAAWSRDSGRPALLYLQYMDPHAPYDPPQPFRARFAAAADDAAAAAANRKLLATRWFELSRPEVDLLESLYDAEVANVDAQLRDLFAELSRRGFLDDAIVVVTADHGEEFWEHGNLTHGIALYEESVRVPLIIAPTGMRQGSRVATPVSLVDVAPTLLDLLGVTVPERFEGRSLAAAVRDRDAAPAGENDAVLLELEAHGEGFDAREHVAALRRGALKLLLDRDGRPELYDLAADPGEQSEAPAAADARTPPLVAALGTLRATLGERAAAPEQRVPLDAATQEKLRALGYHF